MKTIIYYGNIGDTSLIEKHFKKVSILESYAYIKDIKERSYVKHFFLDSGAFTVFKQGKQINIQEYITFIKEHEDKIKVYANLDVIGDPEGSFKNYKIMRKAGLEPLPVWHAASPLEYLHKYADMTDYIGLGAIANMCKKDRLSLLSAIFKRYPDPEKVGFHGFGIGDTEILALFPWQSIDSTTIHTRARYGCIVYPGKSCLSIGEGVSTKAKAWQTNTKLSIVKDYIESLGIDATLAFSKTTEGSNIRVIISMMYYEKVNKELGHRKPYKSIGFRLS